MLGGSPLTPTLTRAVGLGSPTRSLSLTRTQAHTRSRCTAHTLTLSRFGAALVCLPLFLARRAVLRSRPIRTPTRTEAVSQPWAAAFLSLTLALMPTRTQPSPGRCAATVGGGGPVSYFEHLPDEPALRRALRQRQGVHRLQVAQRRPEREGHRSRRQARLQRH